MNEHQLLTLAASGVGADTGVCAIISMLVGEADGEKLLPSIVGELRAMPGWGEGVDGWGGGRKGGPMSEAVVDFLMGDFLPSFSYIKRV